MKFNPILCSAIIASSLAWGTFAHAQGATGGDDLQTAPGGQPTAVSPGEDTAEEPADEDAQQPTSGELDAHGFDGIRPDRSPVNPNEFEKIRPQQSPVNPNEFRKIRPQQSPVNPNEFRKIRPQQSPVNPNEFDKIRPDATGFDADIQVRSLDELRGNPNEFRAIDPDQGVVIDPDEAPAIDPDEGFDDLGELAPIREAGAVQRASQFQSAFSRVQEHAAELEPGSQALPLRRDVEELTRGADELRVRFTRVGRDFDELGYTARARRAEQVALLFQELQARLALFGLELVQRDDVTTIPADLEFNFELLEETLLGFPSFD